MPGAAGPLTSGQERLWFLDQLEPGNPALAVGLAARLDGPLEPGRLRRALDAAAAAQPELWAGFGRDGRPTRSAGPPRPVALEEQAVAEEADLEERAAACAFELARRPFDTASGPLLRAVLLRTRPDLGALVLVAHGLVADRRGLEALLEDALAAHAELAAGGAPRLAPRPSLAGLATEEQVWLSGEGAELLERGRARLAGLSTTLDLPTDRPRATSRGFEAGRLRCPLPPELVAALDAAAETSDATRADLVLGAFGLLLSRYSRQAELLVGERVSPRRAGDLARCCGPLEDAVVLRLDLAGHPGGREWLGRVKSARREAGGAGRVPFAALVQVLAPPRDASRAPVFQVVFSHRGPAEPARWTAGALQASLLAVGCAAAEPDLGLELDERGGRVECRLEYRSDLFDPATVERLRGHLLALLAGLCASPEAPVSSLDMLTPDERRQLVLELNQGRAFPGETPLHRQVEAQAARRPEAVAVSCGDERLTYAELDRRANRLARALRAAGVGRGTLVAVCMERSVQLVTALLAVLKAGGAYVPLEPANPPERIRFVLDDTRAPVVLTQASLAERVDGGAARLLFVEAGPGGFGEWDDADLDDPPGEPEGEALAYVIYTSGSTGRPKGCMVSHRNVARLFEATWDWFGFGPDDVWSMFHSVAFDFSVWEIWGALLHGGRVVVVPHEVNRSPEDFYRLCAQERVTVLNQTPSAFRQLVAAEAAAGPLPLALRLVIFGGEALEFESLRPWFERHGDEHPRLVNMYGITETTVHVTYRPVRLADLGAPGASVIGRPIPDLQVYLLDPGGQVVPVGVPGEIHVGGAGVALGYLDRPELTAEKFVPDPFRPGGWLYRSGDLARYLPGGELDYLGRIDHQVKVRGFRIETGEIESVLRRKGLVRDVAVLPHRAADGETLLVAYVVSDSPAAALRAALRQSLPEYMVPAGFVHLAAIPMTVNGKVDRRALPPPERQPESAAAGEAPRTELEQGLAAVWREVLGLERVGLDDSFFDLGGNSIRIVQVAARLRERLGLKVPVAQLFQHATLRALGRHLAPAGSPAPPPEALLRRSHRARAQADEPIAVVGLAARFPGARDVEELWRALAEGRETTSFFAPEEIDPRVPEERRLDPAYVRARGVLEGAELFDAAFFGLAPREADLTDPQQRLMLELAWEALEDAGCDPARFDGLIGTYCGEYNVTYYLNDVLPGLDPADGPGAFAAMLGNEKDFVATRVAHRLDLKGPALSLHTGCSTSLVAVAQAFWALRTHQCDLALAGGVAISYPQRAGHVYQEGGMLSADGHCRPFDAAATGTVFSDGGGLVVLRRLGDALAAGDRVRAVIRGVATNNDGGHKMSFTAPSVEGQAQVVAAALALADVAPREVGYVEAHGTATPLGDPIEVEALTQAFAHGAAGRRSCGLGSIKSNFGHVTAAAGVAGLIKTVLALERELLPATLHYERPNPRIDFESGPFHVVAQPTPWPRGPQRRLAGVSSFGVGGTNCHVVVEEAPLPEPRQATPEVELLPVSARSATALEAACARLADRLEADGDLDLGDVAHTLQTGRRAFALRRAVVARDRAEAVAALRAPARGEARAARPRRELVFVFPGQGSQQVGMCRGLHEREPFFRGVVAECSEVLKPALGADLRELLYPAGPEDEAAAARLRDTRVAQPALFVVEYALARLYERWGLRPALMMGHSVGEFVAACLAGVMSLPDALALVAERGRLMQAAAPGTMLSVRCPAAELEPRLGPRLSLAAVNAPRLCVVAGPEDDIAALAAGLERDGLACSRLHTSHAFHSWMMDPVVEPFAERVRRVALAPPRLPFVSTVTGLPITAAQATDPLYWARHVRATVRFADALAEAWKDPERVLLEVGPRNVATQLARQSLADPQRQLALATFEGGSDGESEWAALCRAVGRLWAAGLEVDWAAFAPGPRRRVPLPTYPFERRRHAVEPRAPLARAAAAPAGPAPAGPGGEVQQILSKQLELMALQLEALATAPEGEES